MGLFAPKATFEVGWYRFLSVRNLDTSGYSRILLLSLPTHSLEVLRYFGTFVPTDDQSSRAKLVEFSSKPLTHGI